MISKTDVFQLLPGRDCRPVGEAHAVLLHVQRGELLVVPQTLLLLAGDSQVEAQHGVGLQLHRLTSVQTCRHKHKRETRQRPQ